MTAPYQFNPHRHVKIWLSDKPNIFMNFENQLRLIEMRRTNPQDMICLIFDSVLLTEQAEEDLHMFCEKHSIFPVDYRTDIKGFYTASEEASKASDEETELMAIYEANITRLKSGGNLAAARDILSWLRPVYKMGVYADFDTEIDTRTLPDFIEVDKPLLLNLGSIVLSGVESPAVNNDIMAIVDEEDASEQIKKIQKNIIYSYNQFGDFLSTYLKNFDAELLEKMNFVSAVLTIRGFRNSSPFFMENQQSRSALEARARILSITRNNNVYAQKIYEQTSFLFCLKISDEEAKKIAVEHLRRELKSHLGWIGWLLLPSVAYKNLQQMALIKDDEAFLTASREKYQTHSLKFNVTYTAGPCLISWSLFKFLYSKEDIEAQVKPFSWSHYGLSKAFSSSNSFGFHATSGEFNAIAQQSEQIGVVNDLSWLEAGKKAMESRERVLRQLQDEMPQKLANQYSSWKQSLDSLSSSSGIFSYFHKTALLAKKTVLGNMMSLFSDKGFNLTAFKENYDGYKKDINITCGLSEKTLFEDLSFLTERAEFLDIVDKEGFIPMAQELNPNSVLGNSI